MTKRKSTLKIKRDRNRFLTVLSEILERKYLAEKDVHLSFGEPSSNTRPFSMSERQRSVRILYAATVAGPPFRQERFRIGEIFLVTPARIDGQQR